MRKRREVLLLLHHHHHPPHPYLPMVEVGGAKKEKGERERGVTYHTLGRKGGGRVCRGGAMAEATQVAREEAGATS